MKRIIAVASAACLLGIGFAVGRQESTPEQKKSGALMFALAMNELKARADAVGVKPKEGETTPDLAAAYSDVAADPAASSIAVSSLVNKFFVEKTDAKSAAQVSQLANEMSIRLEGLQAAQNARIIALLEKLVETKK